MGRYILQPLDKGLYNNIIYFSLVSYILFNLCNIDKIFFISVIVNIFRTTYLKGITTFSDYIDQM